MPFLYLDRYYILLCVPAFIIALIAKRNFVLANGDVLGMSNEVGRLFSLLFMACALYFI